MHSFILLQLKVESVYSHLKYLSFYNKKAQKENVMPQKTQKIHCGYRCFQFGVTHISCNIEHHMV